MFNKKPPFEITEKAINLVIHIGELVGRVGIAEAFSTEPTLRKTNRIKTIYSSLAIEQNTLTLEQVTALLAGKRVLAPQRDITEVQNAYDIYNHMDKLNPYSVDDFLLAHEVMTKGLVQESGMFRSRPAGVVDSKGNILHFGTLPQYVPDLIQELFLWAKNSDLHILIKSCVLHYEIELIHPFADGNGRMGRLWHTLLLSKWNPVFEWLPVESLIHDHQKEYYEAINLSNAAGQSEPFIEFMLQMIAGALEEAEKTVRHHPSALSDKAEHRREQIQRFLQKKPYIMNSDVQKLLSVSPATAGRILSKLEKEGILTGYREGSYKAYKRAQHSSASQPQNEDGCI